MALTTVFKEMSGSPGVTTETTMVTANESDGLVIGHRYAFFTMMECTTQATSLFAQVYMNSVLQPLGTRYRGGTVNPNTLLRSMMSILTYTGGNVDFTAQSYQNGGGPFLQVWNGKMLFIDLDSPGFAEDNSWFSAESAGTHAITATADWANQRHVTKTWTPDGVSDYFVIACTKMNATSVDNGTVRLRLNDSVDGVLPGTLVGDGWKTSGGVRTIEHVHMSSYVYSAPSAVSRDLHMELSGRLGTEVAQWSSLLILKMDAFIESVYNQQDYNASSFAREAPYNNAILDLPHTVDSSGEAIFFNFNKWPNETTTEREGSSMLIDSPIGTPRYRTNEPVGIGRYRDTVQDTIQVPAHYPEPQNFYFGKMSSVTPGVTTFRVKINSWLATDKLRHMTTVVLGSELEPITVALTSSLDVSVLAINTLPVETEVLIQGTSVLLPVMNAHIAATVEKTLDLDVLFKSLVQASTGLDVTITATPESTLALDMLLAEPLPNRFMRVREDLTTRYFGGEVASEANFPEVFDPPNGARIESVGIGMFNAVYQGMRFTAINTIPTNPTFDKYSLPLSAPITLNTVGTRVLVNFRLDVFGDNSSLMLGLFNDQLNPLQSIFAQDLVAFVIETEKGHVEFRGWFGSSATGANVATSLPISRFIGTELVLEIEVVDAGVTTTCDFRLYERDLNLSNPIFSFSVTTSAVPTVDRFSVTSLGKRNVDLPISDMTAQFEYVDVEEGAGTLYDPSSTGVQITDAKWRPFQDRPPIEILGEGDNDIFVALSDDMITSTVEAQDTINVDSDDPMITVVSFTPDSGVLVPDLANPPVVKGSTNSNFDGVTMEVSADKTGVFSLRIASTSITDGTEIWSLAYPTASVVVEVSFNFSDFPQVDGIYDVTLYLLADSGKPAAKKLGEYILP